MELDRRGIPGGFVASTEFVEAARAQGEALGFHPFKVFVEHPIQDRTEGEIKALAEKNFSSIVSIISRT